MLDQKVSNYLTSPNYDKHFEHHHHLQFSLLVLLPPHNNQYLISLFALVYAQCLKILCQDLFFLIPFEFTKIFKRSI